MSSGPRLSDIAVDGGDLRVARWGDDKGPVVIGAHGVTAAHLNFGVIAAHLPETISLVVPDLRGRGGSAHIPGPFGMKTHARDLVSILDHFEVDKAIVVGISMGGAVATVMAGEFKDRVDQVLLVDGGAPLRIPEGMSADDYTDLLLGPAIARLSMTFPSKEAYFDFWKAHPAFAETGEWSEFAEAYFTYDLVGEPPELHSGVSHEAVIADSRDQLTNPDTRSSFERVKCPIHLMRATRGLLNTEPLIPDELSAVFQSMCPQLTEELVDDTNHYTLCLGERPAKIVADRIAERVSADPVAR